MTLRDLTEKQRKKLMRRCFEEYKMRNRGLPENKILELFTYKTGFSDGIRVLLEHVDKLV